MEQIPTAEKRLFDAVQSDLVDLVKQELKNGTNPNGSRKPLLVAITHDNHKICKLLLEHGANPNTRGATEISALMMAADCGNEPIARLLIEFGANVDAHDEMGDPVFNRAVAISKSDEICAILAEYGANPYAKDRLERNVLESARAYRRDHRIPSILINANFHPIMTNRAFAQFMASRDRIAAALWAFKRVCPLFMPKDIRKMILRSIPELQQDLLNCSQFGPLKNIRVKHTMSFPFQVVRILIKSGQLNAKETIAHIKQYTLYPLNKLLSWEWERLYRNPNTPDTYMPWRKFHQEYSDKIECVIKKRLELLSWGDRASDAVVNCVVQ